MKILRIPTFNEKPYLIFTLFYVHRWQIIDETSTKSIFDKVSHSISSWDLFKFFMGILKTLFLAKDSLRKFLQVICFLNTWGLRAIFLHVTDLIFKRWWKINETIITGVFSFNSYMDRIFFWLEKKIQNSAQWFNSQNLMFPAIFILKFNQQCTFTNTCFYKGGQKTKMNKICTSSPFGA